MTSVPQAPGDPLAVKRQRLAEVMNARLTASYRFNGYMDSEVMKHVLERGRDYYSADMPEIRSLPESQLDALLVYYGADSRYVYLCGGRFPFRDSNNPVKGVAGGQLQDRQPPFILYTR